MKKIVSLLVLFSMLFSLPTFAESENSHTVPDSANNMTMIQCDDYVVYTTENLSNKITFSEYDYYQMLQNSTDEALIESGLSRSDIAQIRSQPYANLVLKRAMLSEQELLNLGYNRQEIALLKEIEAQTVPLDSETLYAVSATCKGDMKCLQAGTRSFAYQYNWIWTHAPAVMWTDTAATNWRARTSSGNECKIALRSYNATVDYYTGDVLNRSVSPEYIEGSGFTGVQYKFSMGDDSWDSAWAKCGRINVALEIPAEITSSMAILDVYGLYGHSWLQVIPSFSVTDGSVAPSFSFGINISPDGECGGYFSAKTGEFTKEKP